MSEAKKNLTPSQYGTAEAGTELPAGSRPSIDAGMKPVDAIEDPQSDHARQPQDETGSGRRKDR